MKKAVNISIGQTLFTIEEDAYLKLDDYLKSIRKHFTHSEDKEEIIIDIESRITEQFLEAKKKIITFKEVEKVIESMGTVEDFEEEEGGPTVAIEAVEVKEKKKLYRDSENKIIAGVCSGFGVYFNIKPIWIRILFIIFIIVTYGFGIILYILFAILIPEAKTNSQKLEMEGTPVTLGTMSENFKEKAEKFQKKNEPKIRAILAWPFEILAKFIQGIVLVLLPAIQILVAIFLVLGSLAAMVALSFFASITFTNGETYFDFPLTEILSTPLLFTTVISGYLTLLLPLIVIFILAISLIKRKNLLRIELGLSMLFIWIIASITASVSGFNSVQKLAYYVQTNPNYQETTREIPLDFEADALKGLQVMDGIYLDLIQGPELKLTVNGRPKDFDTFKFDQTDGILTLQKKHLTDFCFFCEDLGMNATLTVPSLDSLETLYGSNIASEEHWKSDQPIHLNLANGYSIDLNLEAPEIHVETQYGSHLNLEVKTPLVELITSNGSSTYLRGTAEKAILSAEYASSIITEEAVLRTVEAHAHEGGTITLGQTKLIDAFADYGGTIEYRGTPVINEKENNGGRIENVDYIEPNYEDPYQPYEPAYEDLYQNSEPIVIDSIDDVSIDVVDEITPADGEEILPTQ